MTPTQYRQSTEHPSGFVLDLIERLQWQHWFWSHDNRVRQWKKIMEWDRLDAAGLPIPSKQWDENGREVGHQNLFDAFWSDANAGSDERINAAADIARKVADLPPHGIDADGLNTRELRPPSELRARRAAAKLRATAASS